MNVLGLETSCDETAASIVSDGEILSNVIATQHDLHETYAGVVPEIASRAHLERILPVVREALETAGLDWADLDGVAVGHRPGLIGSLLVGVSSAKAIAWSLGIPFIGVDHVAAHLYSAIMSGGRVQLPALGLIVSGGHTCLVRVDDPLDMHLLGKTIDDAVGEAYDKAATILGLGYPGGPKLDRLAADGDDRAHDLPISRLGRESLDFSFSGLKTSLLYRVKGQPGRRESTRIIDGPPDLTDQQRADFAASFQRAAVAALILKVNRALDMHAFQSLLVGGGVSANTRLRAELTALADERDIELCLPPVELCLDNAAMIAGYGAEYLRQGHESDLALSASTRTSLREQTA